MARGYESGCKVPAGRRPVPSLTSGTESLQREEEGLLLSLCQPFPDLPASGLRFLELFPLTA